jgi:hypothetical protein
MKRALVAVLPAVLAVGLLACGDDDDNTPSTATSRTTTATGSDETETTSGSSGGPEFTLPGGGTLPGGTILPGGSLPNLSLPDFSIPELGSLPVNVEDVLKSIFPNLTDDQVSCLADKLGGQIDTSKILSQIQSCGIDLSDLTTGG